MKKFDDLPREYRGDGEKSYIVFSVPMDDDVKQYQIEMLRKNPVGILLPLSAQRVNDSWKLSYDITSRITLNRILERRPLSKEEFEHVIVQFVKLIRELKDYLLDLSSVVLDSSCIFCDPSGLSLYFLYMPLSIGGDDPNRLKNFLKKLIVEEIQLLDDASGSLLKRLLEVLKSETFSAEQLSRCIQAEDSRTGSLRSDSRVPAENEHFSRIVETPSINKSTHSSAKIRPGKFNEEANYSTVREIFPRFEGKKPDKKRLSQNSSGALGPNSSYMIAGVVNGVLLGMLIFILFSVKSGSGRLGSTIAGFMLIAAAVNYFLFTRLLKHDKKPTEKRENREPQNQGISRKRFMSGALEEDIILPQIPKAGKKSVTDVQEYSSQQRISKDEAGGKPENEPGKKSVGSTSAQIPFAGAHNEDYKSSRRHDSGFHYANEERTGPKLANISFLNDDIHEKHMPKTPEEEDAMPWPPGNGSSEEEFRKPEFFKTSSKPYQQGSSIDKFNKPDTNTLYSADCTRNGSSGELNQSFGRIQVQFPDRNADTNSKKRFASDKTVVLGEGGEHTPYLQSVSNPEGKIELSKASILLGRLENSVDYVIPNRAVGKIHAEILSRDDGFYIIDLNSVNGTYVNGERIVCNTEIMIKNGDSITFANERFTFIA